MAFIREEKVNTINCRLGKRNRETAVAISSSNNDQARLYCGTTQKLWRILADKQTARYPWTFFAASRQGPAQKSKRAVSIRGTALEMESSCETS